MSEIVDGRSRMRPVGPSVSMAALMTAASIPRTYRHRGIHAAADAVPGSQNLLYQPQALTLSRHQWFESKENASTQAGQDITLKSVSFRQEAAEQRASLSNLLMKVPLIWISRPAGHAAETSLRASSTADGASLP